MKYINWNTFYSLDGYLSDSSNNPRPGLESQGLENQHQTPQKYSMCTPYKGLTELNTEAFTCCNLVNIMESYHGIVSYRII